MKRPREFAEGWQPTAEQALLLRAAVLQKAPALEAWRRWRARSDFDALDRTSLKLVPQLYRNLVQHDVTDPLLGKLKGIYRFAWSRSQIRLRTTAGVLTALHEAGVATLVLKGLALAALHYRDHGARPMDDVDVLVPWSQAAAAMDVLTSNGWAAPAAGPPTRHIAYRHAAEFREPAGGKLDLHWNVFFECCGPAWDESFWRAAVPVEIGGVRTRALCPADQLLHVCVHGAVGTGPSPIRWIADAAMILRSAADRVDWDRLVDEAARRRLVVTTARALAYLADQFDLAVPAGVLDRLRRRPRRWFEGLECRAKSRSRAPRILGDLPPAIFHLARLADGAGGGGRRVGLTEYLAYRWHIDKRSDVPSRIARKALRRLLRVPVERLAGVRRVSQAEPARR